jgi:hypothetical protein
MRSLSIIVFALLILAIAFASVVSSEGSKQVRFVNSSNLDERLIGIRKGSNVKPTVLADCGCPNAVWSITPLSVHYHTIKPKFSDKEKIYRA